ncbi:hypothetical protein EJ04DRAFT_490041 [Polyplosphaeria fusca]|uniref:Uncharacterized protein n=1 Tax=Polyplosphaeria fusca TaxID=682080 RepID=A0A9P4V4D9_9PLEO|nr:hypothetical protein EJ04DRAFT_490041 [Polyplosphaeria fusca]
MHEKLPEERSLLNIGDVFEDEQRSIKRAFKSRNIHPSFFFVAILLLSISLLANLALFGQVKLLKTERGLGRSEYTGLALDTPSSYHIYTEFINHNRSISDPLWEALDSSPIVVALDAAYARRHKLKESIPFPWDQSKGLYHIKAFHHIHCLKNIRHAYLTALSSPESESRIPPSHILHCLDTIRQDLMCHADDTPMPTVNERHKIGDGQPRKCKNWDALVKWTQEPERQTCFRMIDEYRRVPNSLEEFAFCPEGQEFDKIRDSMNAYFGKWGHKDPFGGGKKSSG